MQSEREIMQKAMNILWQTMEPSQLVVPISLWFSDDGDYLKTRDRMFAGETVASLAQKIRAMQKQKS